MRRRRPHVIQAAIAFVCANACAWSYATGRIREQWEYLGALFLLLELGGAVSQAEGDTFTEAWRAWVGLKPWRPGRFWLRVPPAPLFCVALGAHLFGDGSQWWSSWQAIVLAALPLAAVVVWCVLLEGPMFDGLKNKVVRWLVRRKLEAVAEDLQKEGKPMQLSAGVKAGIVFVGAAALEAGATYLQTDTTPTLQEGVKAIVVAGIVAVVYLMRGPLPANSATVQRALDSGHMKVLNDDPKDPVVLSFPDRAITPPAVK
jgi:hypothetical protein